MVYQVVYQADTQSTQLLIIAFLAFFLLLAFREDIAQRIYTMERYISYESIRGILCIFLGFIFKWGIDVVMSGNMEYALIAILGFTIIILIMSAMDKMNRAGKAYLDWQYWETMKKIVKSAIRELKQEEQKDKDEETHNRDNEH